MIDFVLTEAAEADLRAVVRLTRKHWGDRQVRRYVGELEQAFLRLVNGQGPFKDMGALYPALRMARCEYHYVFGLARDKPPALIVATFHERMDLMTRLADRLKL